MNFIESIRTPKGEILYEESEILKRTESFKNRNLKNLKKWDIYWVRIKFEDDPGSLK